MSMGFAWVYILKYMRNIFFEKLILDGNSLDLLLKRGGSLLDVLIMEQCLAKKELKISALL